MTDGLYLSTQPFGELTNWMIHFVLTVFQRNPLTPRRSAFGTPNIMCTRPSKV